MSDESDSCGQTELRMSPKAAVVQRIMNCMGTSGFLYRLKCPATIYGLCCTGSLAPDKRMV